MSTAEISVRRTPAALYALTAGAFGIGTTEFVIMGLLLQVASDLHVSITAAGLLISGYALGVCFGAPLLTAATGGMPRKKALIALMAKHPEMIQRPLVVKGKEAVLARPVERLRDLGI